MIKVNRLATKICFSIFNFNKINWQNRLKSSNLVNDKIWKYINIYIFLFFNKMIKIGSGSTYNYVDPLTTNCFFCSGSSDRSQFSSSIRSASHFGRLFPLFVSLIPWFLFPYILNVNLRELFCALVN